MTHPVEEIMEEATQTFLQRNKVYGDGWNKHGAIMFAIFGDKFNPKTEQDFVRLGLFSMLLTKLLRYAENMHNGGHYDSAHDAIVYSAILELLTKKE